MTDSEYQRLRGASRRAFVAELKISAGCADCGYSESAHALDFDHRSGKKEGGRCSQVSWMMQARLEKLLAEIEKCDIVCANCHRVKTHST